MRFIPSRVLATAVLVCVAVSSQAAASKLTGQYGGDEQVYVIPADGGFPTQLTFYPAAGPLRNC